MKNTFAIIAVIMVVNGCSTSPMSFLNKSENSPKNRNNIEICQNYLNGYSNLTSNGAKSLSEAQKQSLITLSNEMNIRGLNPELCKRLITDSNDAL